MGTISWNDLNYIIESFNDRALAIGGEALTFIAENIWANSLELVPYDTGALSDSGEVSDPEIDGSSVSVEIGYGSPDVPYAIDQHENMEYAHPNGRQAKYLEQPALEAIPYIQAQLDEAFQDIFEP